MESRIQFCVISTIVVVVAPGKLIARCSCTHRFLPLLDFLCKNARKRVSLVRGKTIYLLIHNTLEYQSYVGSKASSPCWTKEENGPHGDHDHDFRWSRHANTTPYEGEQDGKNYSSSSVSSASPKMTELPALIGLAPPSPLFLRCPEAAAAASVTARSPTNTIPFHAV